MISGDLTPLLYFLVCMLFEQRGKVSVCETYLSSGDDETFHGLLTAPLGPLGL
jgi:hypothetical protein